MSCETYLEDLSAWRDGALSPGEADRLERHLAACEPCRTFKLRLESLETRLEVFEIEGPSQTLLKRLQTRLKEEDPPKVVPFPSRKAEVHRTWFSSRMLTYGGLAAGFAVAVLLAWPAPKPTEIAKAPVPKAMTVRTELPSKPVPVSRRPVESLTEEIEGSRADKRMKWEDYALLSDAVAYTAHSQGNEGMGGVVHTIDLTTFRNTSSSGGAAESHGL